LIALGKDGTELTKMLNDKARKAETETGAWDAGAGAPLPCATAAPAPLPKLKSWNGE
jgi:hypothetical protein